MARLWGLWWVGYVHVLAYLGVCESLSEYFCVVCFGWLRWVYCLGVDEVGVLE